MANLLIRDIPDSVHKKLYSHSKNIKLSMTYIVRKLIIDMFNKKKGGK